MHLKEFLPSSSGRTIRGWKSRNEGGKLQSLKQREEIIFLQVQSEGHSWRKEERQEEEQEYEEEEGSPVECCGGETKQLAFIRGEVSGPIPY